MTQAISFGDQVRRRRAVLGLTQAELAGRVSCATITIRKIETDERRPSRQMATALAPALEIEAAERDRFVAAARSYLSPAKLAQPTAPTVRPSAVPKPMHPILGREEAVRSVLAALDVTGGSARLVTITGPPGVGKTRLALELAARIEREFDFVTIVVELATARSREDVRTRLATAVSVPGSGDREDSTLTALRRVPSLVLLDNFEQLVAHGDLVTELLSRCPALSCLVTSRTRLDVYGEHEFALTPLRQSVARDLFVQRARAAVGTWSDGGRDRIVAEICRRLDRLPLAIELAARRVRELPLTAIADELEHGLGVLGTGPRDLEERHRTMTGAVEWSYSLLDGTSQQVLRALAVTAAAFDARDAEALADVSRPEGTAALTSLADHGLIRREGAQYRMFEVVRAVVAERLADHGEESRVRDRHAEHMARIVTEAREGDGGIAADEWLVRIDGRYDDLRAALRRSLDSGDPRVGRQLVYLLGSYWLLRGLWSEGETWARLGVASSEDPATQAGSRLTLGVLTWSRGDVAAALDHIDSALTGAGHDRAVRADALGFKGLITMLGGGLADAERLLLDSRDDYSRLDGSPGRSGVALTEMRLGRLAQLSGDLQGFEFHADRALGLFEEMGSAWGLGAVLPDVAEVRLARGDPDAAIALCLRAMEELDRVDAQWHSAAALVVVMSALVVAGRYRDAARVCGIVAEWNEQMGTPVFPIVARAFDADRDLLRESLGPDFDGLHEDGRSLPHTIRYLSEWLLARPG